LGSVEQPIVIGAFDVINFYPEELAKWRAWAQRMSNATSLSIIIQADFPSEMKQLEALGDGEIHLAYLSALGYIYGSEQGWVIAGAIDSWAGQTGRAISFITRTDSGIQPSEQPQVLQQLEGMRPCYRKSSPQSPTIPPLEEYILPAGLLARSAVKTGSPVFIEGESDQNSVEIGVFQKECDFAAIDAISSEEFKNILPGGLGGVSFERWAKEMQVLYTTSPIYLAGVIALSSTLPPTVQTQLSKALIDTPGITVDSNNLTFDPSLYEEFGSIVTASNADVQGYLAAEIKIPEEIAEIHWTPPPDHTAVIDLPLDGGAPFLPFWGSESLNRQVLPAIYAELVRLDAKGSYFPYLAAELPNLENGQARFVDQGEDQHLDVEFHLRPGLTWQDGQPLMANDLVFAWELVMNPAWRGSHFGQAGYASEIYVASVDAPAPDRILYHFMSQRQAREAASTGGRLQDPSLYTDLAPQVGPVVPLDTLEVGRNVFPRHFLENISREEIATSDFACRSIYADVFRLVEGGDIGNPVVLEAFEGFALAKPAIQRVVFGASYYSEGTLTYWQSPDQLAEALKAGAIQAQLGFPGVNSRKGEDPLAYDALAAQNLANVTWIPKAGWEVLDFNLDNPHLADLKVRQAIAHAIDRQAIIDQVLAGHGELMRSYLPGWQPLYAGDSALPDYAYDLGQARALLKEAGYDLSQFPAVHPERGPLILKYGSMDVNYYPRPKIAELIQEQLAAVGIQVEVRFYSWPEYEGQDCSAIRNGRKFDLGMAGWVGMDTYPIHWVENTTLASSIPTLENGCPYENSNWSGWRNAQVDEIIQQLSDGQLALNQPDEYRQLWADHQRLWATELPSLPLFNSQRPVVVALGLSGVHPSPFAFNGVEDTWNIYEWRLK
jgi:peptide/nickel transport system substrate-binding protein